MWILIPWHACPVCMSCFNIQVEFHLRPLFCMQWTSEAVKKEHLASSHNVQQGPVAKQSQSKVVLEDSPNCKISVKAIWMFVPLVHTTQDLFTLFFPPVFWNLYYQHLPSKIPQCKSKLCSCSEPTSLSSLCLISLTTWTGCKSPHKRDAWHDRKHLSGTRLLSSLTHFAPHNRIWFPY